jgi:hypothetical protein
MIQTLILNNIIADFFYLRIIKIRPNYITFEYFTENIMIQSFFFYHMIQYLYYCPDLVRYYIIEYKY